MWPIIAGLKTYTFIYVLSMLVHLALALFYCRRNGLSRKTGVLLGFCYFFGMAIGARILFDILHSRFNWRNYLDIHYYFVDGLWGGPLAYLAVATAGVILLSRRRRILLDIVVITLPIPMIVAKVACFGNGCCFGAQTDVPWAIRFAEGAEAPDRLPRHPTQLYEIVALLAILIVFRLLDRQRWRGTLLFWFVLVYGVGRPLSELFRAADPDVVFVGPLSSSQAVCLLAAAVSAVALMILRARMGRAGAFAAADRGTNAEPAQLVAQE